MIPSAWQVIVFGTVLFLAGCSSTPEFETRSYALAQRTTEEPLIHAILNDEHARLGIKLADVVKRYGGKLNTVDITLDDVAIVKTTSRGHAAIRKALEASREQIADRGGKSSVNGSSRE